MIREFFDFDRNQERFYVLASERPDVSDNFSATLQSVQCPLSLSEARAKVLAIISDEDALVTPNGGAFFAQDLGLVGLGGTVTGAAGSVNVVRFFPAATVPASGSIRDVVRAAMRSIVNALGNAA